MALSDLQDAVVATSPTYYWTFDTDFYNAGDFRDAFDTTTSIRITSGADVLEGSPSEGGCFGDSALEFNGVSNAANQGHISLGSGITAYPSFTGFSLMAMINPADFSVERCIVADESYAFGLNAGWRLSLTTDGKVKLQGRDALDAPGNFVTDDPVIDPITEIGLWRLLIVTVDIGYDVIAGNTSVLGGSVWLDNVSYPITTTAGSIGYSITGAQCSFDLAVENLKIAGPMTGIDAFSGQMDEFAYWQTVALTEDQINSIWVACYGEEEEPGESLSVPLRHFSMHDLPYDWTTVRLGGAV